MARQGENKFAPVGLTVHTRSSLRKLFVFSILGLALVLGTHGDKYEINGFVTGISLKPIYVMAFAALSIINYLLVSFLAFQRDLPDISHNTAGVDDLANNIKESAERLGESLKQAVDFENHDDSRIQDKRLQSAIERLESSLTTTIGQLNKVSGKFSDFSTHQMVLLWAEFLVPMVIGGVTLIVLLFTIFWGP